jgi:hypothetical protein
VKFHVADIGASTIENQIQKMRQIEFEYGMLWKVKRTVIEIDVQTKQIRESLHRHLYPLDLQTIVVIV